jgi:hypothetical protein
MNPMMRVVSGILGTFFYTKYSWKPIYFNPAHKLASVDISQAFESAGITDVNPNDLHRKRRGHKKNTQTRKEFSNAYRMRKRASIFETRRILQNEVTRYEEWLIFFEKHKRKQDDLADTLLMARAFIGSNPNPNHVHDDSPDDNSDADDNSDNSDDSPTDADNSDNSPDVKPCVFRETTRTMNPTKSKVFSDDYPHYKFCLEERLHKEYGKGRSLNDVLHELIQKSKCKGIQSFRERLRTMTCTCNGNCGGVNSLYSWMFHENHWEIMFGDKK